MLPWLLCGALALLAGTALARLALLRRDLRALGRALQALLAQESNALLTTGSGDRALRELTGALNEQLRALRALRQRYRYGDRALREALVSVAHDLRTPLTAISGYLELMAEKEQSAETARYTAIIAERVRELRALTEALLQDMMIDPERALRCETVDLNAAVEEALIGFYAAFQSRGITPQVRLPAQRALCRADREALSRVLNNLFHNALKYSAGDLAVTVTEAGELVCANSAPSLNGVLAGQLLERFFSVASARETAGLGLHIAKTLAERMGGRLRAEYAQGRLTMRLTLPRAE